ncbi:hypothetical protein DYB25_011969 [Aphanomyces astaci]|uniref:Uncharacterized protein n=1 Tax=Aphanomyces astaci TaxID=112090 RepID=A0A397CZ31_APHAT|nr:hypothetical protein DYB25_011969 [Aphanomyces astaci]RHY55645.1 hypothetical protein DYB38_008354 [Aphanomyces astaci]RHY65288.1 hypothetical protein DYB34_012405 [Aphanomyces astaci]RHY98330.1 hypothetical protein DYB35_007653 [Aphanomyces astaci]
MSFGGFGSAAVTPAASRAAADYDVPPDVPDSIQDIAWSPTANVLAAGSWDNHVRCWEVQQQGANFQAVARAQFAHKGPVLCTAFSGDGSTVFSGSCDKTAMMWQLGGNSQGQQIAQHDQPIRSIQHIAQANCVVTGSWDKTVKYWDTRSPQPQATVQLSDRVYALDVSYPLMVVATADKQIHCFDLKKPSQIYAVIVSPNYQGISVGKFNKTGEIFAYATSYDWHKGVEHYNPQARNVIRLHHVDAADMTVKAKK